MKMASMKNISFPKSKYILFKMEARQKFVFFILSHSLLLLLLYLEIFDFCISFHFGYEYLILSFCSRSSRLRCRESFFSFFFSMYADAPRYWIFPCSLNILLIYSRVQWQEVPSTCEYFMPLSNRFSEGSSIFVDTSIINWSCLPLKLCTSQIRERETDELLFTKLTLFCETLIF